MRKLDLLGDTFGMLLVIGRDDQQREKTKWKCLCQCGVVRSVQTSKLTSGYTTSCGKCAKQIDIAGKRFGRLFAERRTNERDSDGNVIWECRCLCGKRLNVPSSSLRKGNTRSCGCLKKENFTNRKHGMSQSKIYDVWTTMLQRCYNPNNKKFGDYGGRGIAVCAEWRSDFQNFLNWSLENGYEIRFGKDRLTIDRINNDQDYSPGNCRWATYSVQNSNQRPRTRERHL